MRLIDTHCHLAHGRLYPQRQDALVRAREAGVTACVCAAANLQESRTALNVARAEEGVFCIAGVHPHDAAAAGEHYLDELARLCGDPHNVAVGEIGLDYHYDYSPRADQRRVFAEQLALAARLAKAVVIHTREAFADTIAILAESGLPGERVVLHSFSGGPGEASRALNAGMTISFSGIATFAKAEDVRAAAALVPDDRVLVETDAPFLSPEPVRKVRTNEPAHVVHVARRLAEVRGTTLDAFAEQTTANAVRFFGLELPE